MTGPALELRDATVRFGSRDGLRDLSLAVDQEERIALLGPSGVGKTSVLRAIAGLEVLTAGTVRIQGRDVTGLPAEQRGVVYLHQVPSLFPHLSVVENVAFPLEIRGTARTSARRQALAMLERVRMAELATRRVTSLSGGQRHRVALARALAADPAVLLLDEPFAALDPELRADVRESTLGLLSSSRIAATVVVTHDVDEATAVADRVLVLLAGGIAQSAGPRELLARPATLAVAQFLGIPNALPGQRDGRGRFASPLGTIPAAGPAGQMVAVFRSDALRIRPATASDQQTADARVIGVRHRISGTVARVSVAGLTVEGIPDGACPVGGSVALELRVADVHLVEPPQRAESGPPVGRPRV